MCPLKEYVPHREERPIRHCADCGALLSSGNLTRQCWAHSKSWTEDFKDTQLGMAMRIAIGEALDRCLA